MSNALSLTGSSLARKKSRDVEEDETIVIRTTEAKLREAEAKILEIQNLNEIPSSLGKLSIAACAFQFAQALFLFILAARDRSIYYLFTNYPSEEDPQIPDPNEIASFSILWYAPVFIALSGLEHMSCLVFRSSYEWYVARNQNPFRWLEYSFSASTMRCFIAQLAGVTDVHLLFCLFILTGVSIQYAATHEAINAKARADDLPMNWRPFWAGWIGHFATWLVIFNYVAVGNMHSSGSGAVTAIVVILFLLDLTFVINFALQWRRVGLWEEYTFGEYIFILLSFFAKTMLAWIAFGTVV